MTEGFRVTRRAPPVRRWLRRAKTDRPVPAVIWPGSLDRLTRLVGAERKPLRHRFGQRFSVGLGKEGRGHQPENKEQADNRCRGAVAAEADDQGAADQRAPARNEA